MSAYQPSGALQQQIVDAFRSATYVDNRMDVQHTPIYDTVTIAAGGSLSTLTSAFFTNVGPASNKTLAQCNMTQSQRLAAPEAFSIFSISLRISENILEADLITIMNNFALSFWLGQKKYNLAPIWHYPAGGGIWASADASTFANGFPSREAVLNLAVPIVIENQMTFFAQLEGTAQTLTAGGGGGTGATLVLKLDGLYARGVQ